LQPIAAPSILGLFGFMAATLMVGAHMAGWYGDATTPYVLFPFAAIFGGLAQFAAALWSYSARDALATAIHGAWGSFWIAYGILWALVVAGSITIPPTGAAFPAFAFWFIGLAAVTWSGAFASLAESLGIFAVLATLATGSTIAAVAEFVGAGSWIKVAGWVFVFSAGIAWYVATAMLLAGTSGRTILPLGKWSKAANVPGGRPTLPVEFAAGEPGIRHGQ
jgi:succinate-acetate transporter protein